MTGLQGSERVLTISLAVLTHRNVTNGQTDRTAIPIAMTCITSHADARAIKTNKVNTVFIFCSLTL